jgi:GxxExxY protein
MALRMSASERDFIEELVDEVIEAASEVAATLGGGFQRDVYERALSRELALRGRSVKTQASYSVLYKGAPVGGYSADLIVAGRLVVDLECAGALPPDHAAQCRNYLKASGMEMGLLIRFQGSEVEWECVVSPDSQSFAA